MIISGSDSNPPFGLPAIAARGCRFAIQDDVAPGHLYFSPARWALAETGPTDFSICEPTGHQLDVPPALDKAVASRRAEYLAGRLCAALALEALTGRVEEVATHQDRSPVWPGGIVGSISHTKSRAIALVAREVAYGRLGVDLEVIMEEARAKPLERMIIDQQEASLAPAEMPFATFLTLVFSAKEAFYKGVYPEVRRYLGFHDVRLVAVEADALELVPLAEKVPELAGTTFRLHWRIEAGHCLTVLAEPR